MEWVTAARPRIDRCSSAWLIRRFVDPQATFSFVGTKTESVRTGTPFDMPGATHGHRGDQCTFETIVADYKLQGDPALAHLGRLVHDLDFHKESHPWAPAVKAFIAGLLLTEPDDHRALEKSEIVFDALYAYARANQGTA
jgi:hypothetical protein